MGISWISRKGGILEKVGVDLENVGGEWGMNPLTNYDMFHLAREVGKVLRGSCC